MAIFFSSLSRSSTDHRLFQHCASSAPTRQMPPRAPLPLLPMTLLGPIHLGWCPKDLSTSASDHSQCKSFENPFGARAIRSTWAVHKGRTLRDQAPYFDQLVPKSRSTIPPCPVTVTERSEQVIIKRSCGVELWDQTLQAGNKSLSAESSLHFCGLFLLRSVGHRCGKIWYVICVLESWLNAG